MTKKYTSMANAIRSVLGGNTEQTESIQEQPETLSESVITEGPMKNLSSNLIDAVRGVMEDSCAGTDARMKIQNVGRPDAGKEALGKQGNIKKKIMDEGKKLDPVGQEDDDIDNDGDSDKTDAYLKNRRKAVGAAIKLTKGWGDGGKSMKGNYGKLAKEEVEQVDEISKKTVGNYLKKLPSDGYSRGYNAKEADVDDMDPEEGEGKRIGAKYVSREQGAANAVKKLTGQARVNATEEVEPIQELSKKTLASYINKAATDVHNKAYRAGKREGAHRDLDTKNLVGSILRQTRINKAAQKLAKEEVEELDELSKDTLKKYAHKSQDDLEGASWDRGHYGRGDSDSDDAKYRAARTKYNKRSKGLSTAINKLAKEEVEELDELSKKSLAGYVKGAAADVASAMAYSDGSYHYAKKHTNYLNRRDGIKKAADKLSGQARVNANEEAEELDESMSAYDRYTSTHGDLMKLHKSIGDLLMAHKKDALSHQWRGPDKKHKGPHWGHVGDIDNIHANLKDIHDRLAQQGEYRKMNEDVEQIDERRGRPPKEGSAAWKRHQEELSKGKTEGDEPRQHIIQQLQRAKISMQGGSSVKFKNGEEHHVKGAHAAQLLDKYAGMKPFEKEAFQKKIGGSHEALKSEL